MIIVENFKKFNELKRLLISVFDSFSYIFTNIFKTKGLINATKTVAKACVPPVFEKTSIINPIKNPKSNNCHPLIFKGKIRNIKI
jgi:hypothetical protein